MNKAAHKYEIICMELETRTNELNLVAEDFNDHKQNSKLSVRFYKMLILFELLYFIIFSLKS